MFNKLKADIIIMIFHNRGFLMKGDKEYLVVNVRPGPENYKVLDIRSKKPLAFQDNNYSGSMVHNEE